MLGILKLLPQSVAAGLRLVSAPAKELPILQMHTFPTPLKFLRCTTPIPEENGQIVLATESVFSKRQIKPEFGQVRRWLTVSSRTDDKHAKEKEAFMRMLRESKDALKKLDKQIQSMLPSKEDLKTSLQTLGDQLATKMESLSRGYRKEASRLTGSARKTLLDASKKMQTQAENLRSEHPSVDAGVKKMKQAVDSAAVQAKRVNEAVKPHVQTNVDKAACKTKQVADKSLKEGKIMGEKMKKQAAKGADKAASKTLDMAEKAKKESKEMVKKTKKKAGKMTEDTKKKAKEMAEKTKKKAKKMTKQTKRKAQKMAKKSKRAMSRKKGKDECGKEKEKLKEKCKDDTE